MAKQILDINVIIKNKETLNIKRMQEAGYLYKGEYEIYGQLFEYRYSDNTVTQHIKCYLENNVNHNEVLKFCKYLNKNPEYVKQYNELKINLAEIFPNNRAAYTEAKTEFIQRINLRIKNEINELK